MVMPLAPCVTLVNCIHCLPVLRYVIRRSWCLPLISELQPGQLSVVTITTSGSGLIPRCCSAPGDYSDMLELSASAEGKDISVGGAFFGITPRIVSINARPVEARPHGVILVLENTDRPGMVGRIGTLLGEHGVNIATMSLSRNQAGGTALTVLNLDTAPGEELLSQIRAGEDIHSAQVIQL